MAEVTQQTQAVQAAETTEMLSALDGLSKLRVELVASFDLPFLKPVIEGVADIRKTMDPSTLKGFDDLWLKICTDSYTAYRALVVKLGILPQ